MLLQRIEALQQTPKITAAKELQNTLKDSDGTLASAQALAVRPQTPDDKTVTLPIEVKAVKEVPTASQTEAKENANVYNSRFDDENIWANITRSTERLDLEWAKMPPLPDLASASSTTTPQTKTKCHCRLYAKYDLKQSLANEKCKCKNPLNATYRNFYPTKYDKSFRKNLTNTNRTQIPQPLKPTFADCHLFHHEHKSNKTSLDFKHSLTGEDNSRNISLENTNRKVETTTTCSTATDTSTCNNFESKPTSTFERSFSRSKYRKSPRLDCHSRTRCYSHDRLMDHRKTEPLTWLQQHLVLKQTIKTCHKCAHTTTPPLNYETLNCAFPNTTCCQASHLTRACCYNKQCLQEDDQPTATKSEQHKSTNTEEDNKEDKRSQKKPLKVDINVRLVPKSTQREKIFTQPELEKKQNSSEESDGQQQQQQQQQPVETASMPAELPRVEILDLENQEIVTEF